MPSELPDQIVEPGDKEMPNPMTLYEHGVNHAAKLWKDLTGIDHLTAADTVEHIKPTRDYRLRLFKGLGPMEANHLQRVLIWLDKMIQDTLKMTQEGRERSEIRK